MIYPTETEHMSIDLWTVSSDIFSRMNLVNLMKGTIFSRRKNVVGPSTSLTCTQAHMPAFIVFNFCMLGIFSCFRCRLLTFFSKLT